MMPMMAFQNQLLAVDRATPFDRMGKEKISPMTTPGNKRKKKFDQLGGHFGNISSFFLFRPSFFQAKVLLLTCCRTPCTRKASDLNIVSREQTFLSLSFGGRRGISYINTDKSDKTVVRCQ